MPARFILCHFQLCLLCLKNLQKNYKHDLNFSQFWIEICDYTVVCTYDLYIPGCLLACFLIHTNVKNCGIVVHWIPSLLNTCLLTIFKQLLKIFYECLIILVSQLQGRRKIRNLEKWWVGINLHKISLLVGIALERSYHLPCPPVPTALYTSFLVLLYMEPKSGIILQAKRLQVMS